MLGKKPVESVSTSTVAPIVFASKTDGLLQLRVNYCKLYDVGNLDLYPLRRMNDYIANLSQTKVCSTLDASLGYQLIENDEYDRRKSTFTSHYGLYVFSRTLAGLHYAR